MASKRPQRPNLTSPMALSWPITQPSLPLSAEFCATYRGLHGGLLHPLDGLPVVDDPHVLPLDHLVEEAAEGLAVLLVLEHRSYSYIG